MMSSPPASSVFRFWSLPSVKVPGLNQVDENHPLPDYASASRWCSAILVRRCLDQSGFSGLFSRVVLDRKFCPASGKISSFEPFMRAIVTSDTTLLSGDYDFRH
jgi:hypothetical protein